MTVQIDYTPLGGGLDMRSSALAIKPGRLVECLNFEEAFGVQGYRRPAGYERFDGHLQPYLAEYTVVPFDTGTVIFTLGEILNGPSATGQLIAYTLQSGSFGAGTAAGFIVLTNVTGAWADNDYIKQGANARALTADPALSPDISSDDNFNYLRLARNARRALIAKVPGAGSVTGVALYKGRVYAVRDVTDRSTATFWGSSSSGWVALKTGMVPGGSYKFEISNFSGAPNTLKLFGVNGRGKLFSWDGTTFTYAAPIFGSEATSTTSNSIATGSKNFTIVEATRSWQVGDTLTAFSATSPNNSMTGTVTSYSGTALVLNVTAITGTGTFATWEISQADFRDRAFDLVAHKDYLWLAFPQGQLQSSDLGNPMTYTTTSSLFGLGDEITGIISMKGGTLAAFCLNRIHLLTGSTQLDFVLDSYADGTGAILGTVMENGGNAIFLDERGVMSLQGTQAYGSFEPSVFSEDIGKVIASVVGSVAGARMTRSSYQYRLYTTSGQVITFGLMTANPVIRPKDVSPSMQQYAHNPTCFANGQVGLEDAMFFGTDDGYVMRESVGTNFDGASYDSLIRLPFNQFKSPSNNKRFLKLMLELDSAQPLLFRFLQLFDYDDGMFDQSLIQQATADGTGGQYDTSNWNEILWSLPIVARSETNIDGIGRNMALLLYFSSDVIDPFTLQGIVTHFSPRGLRR